MFNDGCCWCVVDWFDPVALAYNSWMGSTGVVLLIVALGNAIVMFNSGLNPTSQVSSLFAIVVFGALGSRFLGNWLTEGAVSMVQKEER